MDPATKKRLERVYQSLVLQLEEARSEKDVREVMERAAGGSLTAGQSVTRAKAQAMLRRMFKENAVDQTVAELLLLNESRWNKRMR